MAAVDLIRPPMTIPARFSYWFMVGLMVLLVVLHLGTPLLAALFTFLALTRLHFVRRRGGKWLAVVTFLVLLSGAIYALGYFVNQSVKAFPEIADKAIPSVLKVAKEYQITVPFTDFESLRDVAFDTVKGEMKYLGSFARFARTASTHLLLLVVGVVVALSLFLNSRFEVGPPPPRDNLYSLCAEQVARRFGLLYQSFVTVMGAQIIISAINTVLTMVFVAISGLPYGVVIVGVTFLCGLIPVVGNLISNTIIVGVGFTVSPRMALFALIFLVTIHKLEYFLNSKIIGWRIRNPLWLTLLGLVIGERLLGLAGMILAPVILNYIRLESTNLKVEKAQPKTEPELTT